ncbi:uncharacterized protein K444DRAFT_665685 [Hyaloscypha bicolor E]|uniref:Uncharacterized protein n=1 Tax=Hyaloscypha bicolor E TaxID=1095630 RepID=A0A2J6T2P8_9HELO|nr:uncharacterized protein K444DRAFT_665685 [Hyaloscypha bicolor E]PMD57298.1 hypothetical protein K444DRAFT_665685 [Hyaloscypha bicolor E]
MAPKKKKGSPSPSANNPPPETPPSVSKEPENPSKSGSSKHESKPPASRIPIRTGSGFSTPSRPTTASASSIPVLRRTVPPNTTATTGLRLNLRPLPLSSFVNRSAPPASLPVLVNTLATPTSGPEEGAGPEGKGEGEGERSKAPEEKLHEDPIAAAPPVDSGSPADSKSEAPAAPSTPDPNEFAVDSPSEVSSPGELFSEPTPGFPSTDTAFGSGEAENEDTLSPPRIIDGRRINTPSAQVAPLFSGPAPQLGSNDGETASESGTESKHPTETFSPPREEGSQATTPNPSKPPTETSSPLIPSTQATTLSLFPSPLRVLRPATPQATSAPPPLPTQTSEAPATTTANVDVNASYDAPPTTPPGSSHTFFSNSTDYQDSARKYPEATDEFDRMATMSTDAGTPVPLRRHRSDRLFRESAHWDPSPSSGPEKFVAAFRPQEISDFQRYAEEHPEDEGVRKGIAALEGAMGKEREQVISHLTLVNANQQLSERMAMRDREMKRAMADATRERNVGRFSQDEMEAAVQKERNSRREVEGELKECRKAADRVERADILLIKEQEKGRGLEERVARLMAENGELKLETEEKDEELEKLRAEKGDWISKEQCADFNAETYRKMDDQIVALEAALAASKGSDGSDENILTEEECNERCAQEKGQLLNENGSLWGQLNNADEALRCCQQANSAEPGQEAPRSDRSLREQIEELGQKLEKYKLDNETQEQLLVVHGVYDRDGVPYNELLDENKNLKAELWSLETANKQLNENDQDIQAQTRKEMSRPATPTLTENQAESVTALKKERAELKDSQRVLRQTNENLRHEMEKVKEKLVDTKEDRDALKETLRKEDGRSSRLGSIIPPEDPELTRCKETIEDYEKDIMLLKKQVEDAAASFRIDSGESEREVTELQGAVDHLILTNAINAEHCEETENQLQVKIEALEVKIAALEEAKADRQRQINRHVRKIAELEGRNPDAPDAPISRKSSLNRDDEEIPASISAMEVVFIRCEIQLGQLQAERTRWGFIDNDANNAIAVACEAQQMAERLDDPNLIGRAVFWRGVAEFMAGNSMVSEVFETSASHQWTEPREERELLQEWWKVSNTGTVDKSTRSDPSVNATPMPIISWPERSKQKKTDEKNTNDTKDNKDKKTKADGTKSKDTKSKGEKKKKHRKHKHKKTATKSEPTPVPDSVPSGPKQVNGLCEKFKACMLQ